MVDTTNQILPNILTITNDLENELVCVLCKRTEQLMMLPCNHNYCNDCLSSIQSCRICKESFMVNEVVEDHFSCSALKCIKEIEKIISSPISDTSLEFEYQDLPKELMNFKVVLKTEIKRNPKGETPLHIACKKNHVQKVKELVKSGFDINIKDYAGWTPLHEAVEKNSFECVQYLLEAGALPNIPGENYVTPFHKAVALNNSKLVVLLLNYGANPNAVDYSGKTPVDYCQNKEILSLKNKNDKKKKLTNKVLYIDVIPKVFINDQSENFYYDFSNVQFENLEALKKGKVTHLVVQKKKCEPYQDIFLQIIYATVQGASIVYEEWLLKFLTKPEDYLGFEYFLKDENINVKKAVINKLQNNPKLFDGMNFFIDSSKRIHKIMDVNFSKEDISNLAILGGAKILSRPPALRTVEHIFYYPYHCDINSDIYGCCNFIIYDENCPPKLLYNMKELRHKSSAWLIKCIMNFSVGN